MQREASYELRSTRVAGPGDLRRLTRAFERLASRRPQIFPRIEVFVEGRTFCVRMETRASEVACEQAFMDAWYDAFGERWTPVRVAVVRWLK